VEQARNAIVLEDKGVLESLRRGWEVFRRSFLTIILTAIIVGVLGGVVGLILVLPMILIVAPVLVAGLMASARSNAFMAPLLVSGLCCLVYVPVLWVLSGIRQSYIQSVWTLTYLRLTATPPVVAAPAIEDAHAG